MKNKLIKTFSAIHNNKLFSSVQKGIMMLFPILLIGAFCLLVKSFPLIPVQNFVKNLAGGYFYLAVSYIYDATYNIMSLLVLITVSYQYAKALAPDYHSLHISASFVAFCSYFASFGIENGTLTFKCFSAVGVFYALFCSVLSTWLFMKLSVKSLKKRNVFLLRSDNDFKIVLSTVAPFFAVVAFFTVTNILIKTLTGFKDVNEFFINVLSAPFNKLGRGLFSAILFEFLSHFLWFFGIHGGNVFEGVTTSFFVPALEINQDLIAQGLKATEIFSKSFLDVFVIMGGSGATICLIIAVLIGSRRKYERKLVSTALPTVLFNINELVVFGFPIVFNPIMLLPFIIVPVLLTITSFLATIIGFVPVVTESVEWTTPIFFSGYAATGSITGSFLQLFNLILGTAVYYPFVRLSEKVQYSTQSKIREKAISLIKESEENEIPINLMDLSSDVGNYCKSLSYELSKDIKNKKITLYYQPQMTYTGEIYGAEALLRWGDMDNDYIYPPLVVEIAQESGLMDELSKVIFEKVCDASKMINFEKNKTLIISVNFTATQITNEQFVEKIIAIAKKSGVDISTIEIEITETMKLSENVYVNSPLNKLVNEGFKIAIDDFSMGHTSLKYLQSNCFSTIKLDGDLTRDIENERSNKIVRSIIELGKELNCNVISECVETEKQKEELKSLGCNIYQGYLYSPAISFDKFNNFTKQKGCK